MNDRLTTWLPLARVVWVAFFILILGLWSVGIGTLFLEPVPDCVQVRCDPFDFNLQDLEVARAMGLPTGFLGGTLTVIFNTLAGLAYFVIAGVIFSRKSDDWMGLLVSFVLVYVGGLFFTSSDDALLRRVPETRLLVDVIDLPARLAILYLLFVFPDGRFIPRRMRWVFLFAVTLILLSEVFSANGTIQGLTILLVPPTILAGATFTQIYRYTRVSSPTERQQTKWVVVGFVGVLSVMFTWQILEFAFPPAQPSLSRIYALYLAVPLINFSALLLPLSLAFSILRYRLWDIDVIIRKTLLYTLLTMALAVVFFGSVTLIQSIVSGLSGQQSALATVLSTLAIAALFNPLRQRIQSLIDRRFYRRKYDAQQVLAAFAQTARDETDLERLTGALVRTVEEAIQPTNVSVWLVNPEQEV